MNTFPPEKGDIGGESGDMMDEAASANATTGSTDAIA